MWFQRFAFLALEYYCRNRLSCFYLAAAFTVLLVKRPIYQPEFKTWMGKRYFRTCVSQILLIGAFHIFSCVWVLDHARIRKCLKSGFNNYFKNSSSSNVACILPILPKTYTCQQVTWPPELNSKENHILFWSSHFMLPQSSDLISTRGRAAINA